MACAYPIEWPSFFPATIYQWKYLLKQDVKKILLFKPAVLVN